MIKVTYVEGGKPVIGLGVEFNDMHKLKDEKQTFSFEIGGQVVTVGYIGSHAELVEKIRKKGLNAKVTSIDHKQEQPLEEKQIVPGKSDNPPTP